MTSRMILAILGMALTVAAVAQTKSTARPVAELFTERIAATELATQSEINTITAMLESVDPAKRDSLERCVVEMKRQGEIRRLEILLEWITAEGDTDRIAEARRALEHLRNPPEDRVLPQSPRREPPGTASPMNRPSAK